MGSRTSRARRYGYHPYIDDYMRLIENREIESCLEQKELMKFVRRKLDSDNVVIDGGAIEKSVLIPAKYFSFELYAWQKFLNAFIYGVRFRDTGELMFSTFLCLVGRGAGKNGFIGWNAFYQSTGHHGIKNYDIDFVATNEEQAKTSFNDILSVLENPAHAKTLNKAFYKSKVLIRHKGTGSEIMFNTANARTKDGKRTGAVYFDEVHEYEDYDRMNVYISGLGKVKDPRIFYFTTDGKVRGGVLDGLKQEAKIVLAGDLPKSRLFPFICKIDKKEEAANPVFWVKANPSLPYNKVLRTTMEQQYYDMQTAPSLYMEFYRKRMNFPLDDVLSEVATYEERLATDMPMPELDYRPDAIGGIDYASKKDFVAVGVSFKHEGVRYFKHHSFVFRQSVKLQGINQGIIDLGVEKGLITLVDGDEIGTELLVEWFLEAAKDYEILKIACDRYRAEILKTAFSSAGFELFIVRKGPITHSLLAPLIAEVFAKRTAAFPDDPVMRWYIGNVYKHMHPNGNTEFRKIEAKRRKTDGFFAWLHTLVLDEELAEYTEPSEGDFMVITC